MLSRPAAGASSSTSSRRFADIEYIFKHALTQEVAYNSILTERRKHVHERMAAAIEAMFAATLDDHVAELAHHYGRSGNAQGCRVPARAAKQAAVRSAYLDAIRYAREALARIAEMPESRERDLRELKIQMMLGPLIVSTQGLSSPEIAGFLSRAQELCAPLRRDARNFRRDVRVVELR